MGTRWDAVKKYLMQEKWGGENSCISIRPFLSSIRLLNNIARYNLIDTKYHQMAFWSPSDGAPISPYQQSFGTPGQTKVSGDRQRETTHEVCCYTSQLRAFILQKVQASVVERQKKKFCYQSLNFWKEDTHIIPLSAWDRSHDSTAKRNLSKDM